MSADHLAKRIVSTTEVQLYLLLYSARIVSVEREFRGCHLVACENIRFSSLCAGLKQRQGIAYSTRNKTYTDSETVETISYPLKEAIKYTSD